MSLPLRRPLPPMEALSVDVIPDEIGLAIRTEVGWFPLSDFSRWRQG